MQDGGFVPLKGIASLPVGTIVDARKGTLGLQSAANGLSPVAKGFRRQQATLRAGMFAIRQRRARRRARRATPTPTDLALVTPSGADAICAHATGRRPVQGVVRTLSATVKGRFRMIGGASTATGRDAIINTTDRCDGT